MKPKRRKNVENILAGALGLKPRGNNEIKEKGAM